MIQANSKQQYDKCQEYLKGNIKLVDMYMLMRTYINELYGYHNKKGLNMGDSTDIECCEILCKNIKL